MSQEQKLLEIGFPHVTQACVSGHTPGPLAFVRSSIQPMVSSSAGPGHVAAAEDAEIKDGPCEPHSLDQLWPLPGAQQSVGLPS